jgi:hypothetical protein
MPLAKPLEEKALRSNSKFKIQNSKKGKTISGGKEVPLIFAEDH